MIYTPRYPYRQSDIRVAAFHALGWLQTKNDGRLPRTFREAWKLTVRCGLSCRHLRAEESRDGELVQGPRGDWTVYYHARLSEPRRALVIMHELVEWLCLTESPELMLGLPGGGLYHYDGGDNPKDVRHRTAKTAEAIYSRAIRARE